MEQIAANILTISNSSNVEFQHISKSIQVIIDTIRIFGGPQTAIAFNGGKDACVVFYLLITALYMRQELDLIGREEIRIVYFEDKLEFPEMKEFLSGLKESLKFSFLYLNMSFKSGMEHLVSLGVKAIILGTRRGQSLLYHIGIKYLNL